MRGALRASPPSSTAPARRTASASRACRASPRPPRACPGVCATARARAPTTACSSSRARLPSTACASRPTCRASATARASAPTASTASARDTRARCRMPGASTRCAPASASAPTPAASTAPPATASRAAAFQRAPRPGPHPRADLPAHARPDVHRGDALQLRSLSVRGGARLRGSPGVYGVQRWSVHRALHPAAGVQPQHAVGRAHAAAEQLPDGRHLLRQRQPRPRRPSASASTRA